VVVVRDATGKLLMECIIENEGGHDPEIHPRTTWHCGNWAVAISPWPKISRE
jgi:hypothetical protein